MKALWTILFLLALTAVAGAQKPDVAQAVEIWRGDVDGQEMRLLQIPKRATALIPLRFLLEPVAAHTHAGDVEACPHCGPKATAGFARADDSDALSRFDFAEITAAAGAEAALSYAPRRDALHLWGNDLAEVRETFRSPGQYRLTFASQENEQWRVTTIVEVRPFAYLRFGEEFGFFVAGCLVLGSILAAVVWWLRRRIPELT